ncbi:MAG: Cytochrome c-type biosis protein CcmH/NrfG, partial [Verrucomicrobiaceae bacterium]|nr:Cytochrome c-type biosis protein CcmH/NrfG [Verrucomicrobiaceae bacterium]
DRVRRHLENRLSQDAGALEDLAQYYKETGQDDAERRVYEQIQRVRTWDARSTLRLALKCIAVADEPAAIKQLRDLLSRTQSKNTLRALPPDRWPFPLTDERKPGGAASLSDLIALLDEARGLEKAEQERLRAFLGVPRAELAELPDDPSLVRLRAIEEMSKVLCRQGETKALRDWIVGWTSNESAPPVERLWALFYAGAHEPFQVLLTQTIGPAETIELQFVHAWLTVRAQGMKGALEWMKTPIIGEEKQLQRKRLLQCACGMLADWDHFAYMPAELAILGNSKLLQPTALLDIVRRLQDRQRYEEAMTLVESLRSVSPEMWRYYTFVLASFAQSAELWDRQRKYLREVLSESPQPGAYSSEGEDPFLLSVVALQRLARTPQERDEMLKEALAKLSAAPPSPLTTMRRAAVQGLAGAVEPAARRMSQFIGGSFLSSRTLGMPYGGLMPQGSVRMEEANFLRTYWEDLRMVGAILAQQGLGSVVGSMEEQLQQQIGSVQLGPKTSDTFSGWRTTRLVRQLREVNFPNRVRLIREHLGSVNMKEEDAVDTLTELGRELEVNGFMRECVDIYRRLPSRAPTNNLYAEYFIRVCEQSWDPQPGREYVESLFGKDPLYKPQGIGDEVLREKHARFLAVQFELDRLRQLAWVPEGFTKVKKGRIANEVPYARELALLLEHMGDKDGALAAWDQAHFALINGTVDDPFPVDPETVLHRARLLEGKGEHPKALDVLSQLPVKDGLDDIRLQALQLRAQVAAAAGRWDDLQNLMSLAVEKRSAETALAITEQLRAGNRNTEALNFLIQAERAMKGGEERFALRLEQLRLLALDKAWNPVTGHAQISALFRTGGRKRESLQRLVDWLGVQSQSTTSEAWLKVLSAEARSSHDPALAALALSAFALRLQDSSLPAEFKQAWTHMEERDRVCLELAAETLLKGGRVPWAMRACEVLRATPSGMQPRLLPLVARVAGAMKDETRLRELYADVVRMPFPGGTKTVQWAEAFEATGHADWSRELYDLANRQMERTQKPNGEILQAHIAFLIRTHQPEAAERLLMAHYYGFIPQTAKLVVSLYKEWGRLDQLDRELPKYYLPQGVEKEVRFLAREP